MDVKGPSQAGLPGVAGAGASRAPGLRSLQEPPGASRSCQDLSENPMYIFFFDSLEWLEAGLCLPVYGKSPERL